MESKRFTAYPRWNEVVQHSIQVERKHSHLITVIATHSHSPSFFYNILLNILLLCMQKKWKRKSLDVWRKFVGGNEMKGRVGIWDILRKKSIRKWNGRHFNSIEFLCIWMGNVCTMMACSTQNFLGLTATKTKSTPFSHFMLTTGVKESINKFVFYSVYKIYRSYITLFLDIIYLGNII